MNKLFNKKKKKNIIFFILFLENIKNRPRWFLSNYERIIREIKIIIRKFFTLTW